MSLTRRLPAENEFIFWNRYNFFVLYFPKFRFYGISYLIPIPSNPGSFLHSVIFFLWFLRYPDDRLRVDPVLDLGGILWISGGYNVMTCRDLVRTSVLAIYGSIMSESMTVSLWAHSLAIQALAAGLQSIHNGVIIWLPGDILRRWSETPFFKGFIFIFNTPVPTSPRSRQNMVGPSTKNPAPGIQ